MSALTISKEDEKRVKGMGFLNNRGTDLFSARVLTVNGKVTAAQHHCMADAAEKFGNGNLLYTTRLSVEIQGIPYDKIEEFQEFIAKEGLVTGRIDCNSSITQHRFRPCSGYRKISFHLTNNRIADIPQISGIIFMFNFNIT